MSLNCLGLADDLADNTQESKQQQESQQEIAQKFGIFKRTKIMLVDPQIANEIIVVGSTTNSTIENVCNT